MARTHPSTTLYNHICYYLNPSWYSHMCQGCLAQRRSCVGQQFSGAGNKVCGCANGMEVNIYGWKGQPIGVFKLRIYNEFNMYLIALTVMPRPNNTAGIFTLDTLIWGGLWWWIQANYSLSNWPKGSFTAKIGLERIPWTLVSFFVLAICGHLAYRCPKKLCWLCKYMNDSINHDPGLYILEGFYKVS